MNTKTLDEMNAEKALMDKAFALVDPAVAAKSLAEGGFIPAADAATVTWKAPIAMVLGAEDLDGAGVTLDDVVQSIAFFTATEATVRRVECRTGTCYLVTAAGYAAGPAA